MSRKDTINRIIKSLSISPEMWYEDDQDYLIATTDDTIVIDAELLVIKSPVFIKLGFFEAMRMQKAISKWRSEILNRTMTNSFMQNEKNKLEES